MADVDSQIGSPFRRQIDCMSSDD